MPSSTRIAPFAAGAALLLLAGGCALARPGSPDAAPRELVLATPGRDSGAVVFRVPLPRQPGRPALPRRSLPYTGGAGMHAEATAAADTGATLVLLQEGPWSPGPAVSATLLPAGRPGGEPALESPPVDEAAPCTSLTAFFLPGVGRTPGRPVIAHFRAGERRVRFAVDPRRHTLRLPLLLRLRPDTLAALGGDAPRPLEARFTLPSTGRMLVVTRDTAGHALAARTFAAGQAMSIRRGQRPVELAFYLMDDHPRHHSPCRGVRPPDPPTPPWIDWTARYIASGIDSVVAAYGVAPLRTARLRRGEREVRLTMGGGMVYEPEYVVRIVARGRHVRGELYEQWSRLPAKGYAGGPFAREKRPAERDGCLDARISDTRWVCRIDRMIPVDWARVLARLDSLHLDQVPPQRERSGATEQGHVLIETARRGGYNGVYYYGPRSGRDAAEAAVATAGGVFRDVVFGRAASLPDSLPGVHAVAPGSLSIPAGVVLVVRDERTWHDLWRRFPSKARQAAGNAPPPLVDFAHKALLVVGNGKVMECAYPPDYFRRAEARGDTVHAVLSDRPAGRWPYPCDPDLAPVQVMAISVKPEMPVIPVLTTGRYWIPQYAPGAPPP
jgi:hypothetical protein